MRSLPVTTIKGGINRLRVKGGARADTLYDLENGYVTESGSVRVRPGTERVATLGTLTRGLCAFGGKLHVFCHKTVTVPTGYVLDIIVHPDPPDLLIYADGVPLKTIHFSEPFLGGLYVVAEFDDDATYHFWLQPGVKWQANTSYEPGALVEPTTPNGLLYEASRYGEPYPPWQTDEPRADATPGPQSFIEPTTANGFYYRCIATDGPTPRSGATEPEWPTFKGGTVIERVDTTQPETALIDSSIAPAAGSTPAAILPAPDPTNPLDKYRVYIGKTTPGYSLP